MLYQATPHRATPTQLLARELARRRIRQEADVWVRAFRQWLNLALAERVAPGAEATPEEAHPNAAIQQLHHEA